MNQVSSPATDATPAALRRRVEITTVDAFLTDHAIDRIHILKSDTEGYELEVLKGAERALTQQRVASILVETTLVENSIHVHLDELQGYLRPYGFRLHGLYDLAYYRDGTLFYCNALFKLQHPATGVA